MASSVGMVTSMYMTSVVLILSSRATTGFHIHSGTRKPAPSLPQTFNVRLHAEKSKSAKRFKKKLAEAPDSSSSEDDTSSQEIDPNAETAAAAAAEASDTINNSPLVGGWSYDSPAPAPPLSAEVCSFFIFPFFLVLNFTEDNPASLTPARSRII